MSIVTFNIIKLFLLSGISAVAALFWAPALIELLKKFKFWKKEARTKTITGDEAEVIYSLHKDRETSVPRGGGVLIWVSVLFVVFLFFALANFCDIWWVK